ncbi:MAG: IS1182 family transposase [Chloroflexi bacterium]|nr:IS1182 family transposase [Chloroflexota bacterium]
MLGKRSGQLGMFEADNLYLDFVGRDTFYGFLAGQRGKLFSDQEFADLYCLDNGRTSVPPSLLATALLLQTHDKVSDEEAKARADFDVRWKVALGVSIEDRPFAKSTLQVFRAQLILHEKVRAVFQTSLNFARRQGHLKQRKIKAVLDTSNILGRGAVKDTYNLLADGIVKLVEALAFLNGIKAKNWAEANGLSRYFGTSIKGEAAVNWDDAKARQAFLNRVVADADRLLEMAREAVAAYAEGSAEREGLVQAAELLSQLLLQDVERIEGEAAIKRGVSRDRIVSVHDPQMRHGRKSKSKRFEGHKVAVAVDPESQLIVGAGVLAGNAPDKEQALDLVEQAEENAQVEVEETIGDCAFGDGGIRQEFVDAGRKLVARVPSRTNRGYFSKDEFRINVEAKTCVCPAGQECRKLTVTETHRDEKGEITGQVMAFHFDRKVCGACQLRSQCVAGKSGKRGRTIRLHPQEGLIQDARAFQQSEEYGPYRKLRQVAEHRIARLAQLGIRQARYFGRAKTLFQLLLAATVANLTLVATKTGLMRGGKGKGSSFCPRNMHLTTAILTAFALLFTHEARVVVPERLRYPVFI